MNLTELSNRRTELLRKRYAGEIESDEQDELDAINDTIKVLYEAQRPRLQIVEVEN
jgi:hypothetical protein